MGLKKIPHEGWQKTYDGLMKDNYLSRKYNRKKRIRDKRKYMTEMTPEIKAHKGENKLILDIGPGPGEWLEICREFGHRIIGIDAMINDCEMGNAYIQLSELMTKRQKIDVYYIGLDNYIYTASQLSGKHPKVMKDRPLLEDNSVFYINSQGSIEQCFKDYMAGTPHRITKKASGLTWIIDKNLKDIFNKMFAEFERILEIGGYIFIWGNGSTDDAAYNKLIHDSIKKFPALKLVHNPGNRIHKIRKVVV